jgi:hypothetical protein
MQNIKDFIDLEKCANAILKYENDIYIYIYIYVYIYLYIYIYMYIYMNT